MFELQKSMLKFIKNKRMSHNVIHWFEIPVLNNLRAKNFYEKILQINMETAIFDGIEMTFFPSNPIDNQSVSGALVRSPMHIPSMYGTIIYLTATPNIQTVLELIPQAGGKVLMPKTYINDAVGYMAFFIDSEGNKVGLHSKW